MFNGIYKKKKKETNKKDEWVNSLLVKNFKYFCFFHQSFNEIYKVTHKDWNKWKN